MFRQPTNPQQLSTTQRPVAAAHDFSSRPWHDAGQIPDGQAIGGSVAFKQT
jgi:hypothetical protein